MTRHATDRLKERGGIPKRAAQKTLDEIRDHAMPQAAAGGRFRRYLDHQSMLNHSIAYLGANDLLYVVKGDLVVTVLVVPQAHRAQSRIQLSKWKTSRMRCVPAAPEFLADDHIDPEELEAGVCDGAS